MINKSPVKNKIGLAFIPVRDIQKAKEWYSKILGLSDGNDYFDHLFAAPMEGTTGLMLDTMPKWRNEKGDISPYQVPAIQFLTEDIHASYKFMEQLGVEMVTEVEYDQYFIFKDPDGNMLMVCQE
ncbi:VOC family protein [Thalassobacillus pellis]|uniref:VOC family protein n=1 Tax=Thalassobacillus pellis TaxID=748008 RepID=UPI001961208B|nr:VOC family protein [Thalassobacillus pellis]MBM7553635.1 catechol 2,3-dioxygenase-like lactoylglutathione lyase family enzyme [Thalassobacillus pellis]